MKTLAILIALIPSLTFADPSPRVGRDKLAWDLYQQLYVQTDQCSAIEEPVVYTIKDKHSDNEYKLYDFLCMYGAYNMVSTLIIDDGESVRPLSFSSAVVENGKLQGFTSSNFITALSFDEKTQEISSHHKFRGIGDCYSDETYAFKSIYEGFSLVSYEVDSECDGELKPQVNVDYRK